jgi:hypothetical protein
MRPRALSVGERVELLDESQPQSRLRFDPGAEPGLQRAVVGE